jgi:hypothetical protein
MSYPLIGGRLRERTSGVGRPQAAFACWGIGPRKGDWSDLGLDVIVRRRATSNRRMVTAAKYVYSTWQFHSQPGEKHGEALYRDRSASQRVHVLPAIGKRQKLLKPVAAGRSAALCEEVAGQRRAGDGDHKATRDSSTTRWRRKWRACWWSIRISFGSSAAR